jgi:hypothetical protein
MDEHGSSHPQALNVATATHERPMDSAAIRRGPDSERSEETMSAIVLHIQQARFLFSSIQERSASRDIDEPEVPEIGVPSTRVDGVDGKPPKDDPMTAQALRSYIWHAVYKAGVSLLYLPAIS